MELLPKWELTGTLPAFSDDDSSTCIEMTYKLYNTMQTLISEYNSFANSVNSKILAFESEYHSDFESFTSSIRQEIQEFTNTFNQNIANLNSRVSEVDSKYQTATTNLQNQINALSSNTYTKTDIDEKLGLYVSNNELNNKLLDYYNKLEVETLIDSKIENAITGALTKGY